MIQRQKAGSTRRSRSGEKSVLVRSGGLTGFARLAAGRRYRATFAPECDNDRPIARSPLVYERSGDANRVYRWRPWSTWPVTMDIGLYRLPMQQACVCGYPVRQAGGQTGRRTKHLQRFNAATMLHVEHRFFRPKRNPAVPGFSNNSVPRGTSAQGQRRSGITT